MLSKLVKVLKGFVAVGMAACVLFCVGYLYLEKKVNAPADTETEKVPYYREAPQNIGVLFSVLDTKTYFYFDFSTQTTAVVFVEDVDNIYEFYGYEVTNQINTDYDTIGGIVDILGGIDLEINGETLNYTGAQVSRFLKTTVVYETLRREIITRIFERMGKVGFTLEDMLYIMQNSKTDLTVPQCFGFIDYLPVTIKNFYFVN